MYQWIIQSKTSTAVDHASVSSSSSQSRVREFPIIKSCTVKQISFRTSNEIRSTKRQISQNSPDKHIIPAASHLKSLNPTTTNRDESSPVHDAGLPSINCFACVGPIDQGDQLKMGFSDENTMKMLLYAYC